MDMRFEFRRKSVHLVFGLVIAAGIHLEVFTPLILLLLALASHLTGILHRRTRGSRAEVVGWLFEALERPENHRTPALNMTFMLLGAALALLLFGPLPAVGGTLILAVGDGVAILIGMRFGRIEIPWNRKKHLEGRLAAIVACTVALLWLVSWQQALLASGASMLIESLPLKRWALDDNLLIPVVAAALL